MIGLLFFSVVCLLLVMPVAAPLLIAVRAKASPPVVRFAGAFAALCVAGYMMLTYEAVPKGRENWVLPSEIGEIMSALPCVYALTILLVGAFGSLGWLLHHLLQRSLFSRASLGPAAVLVVCLSVGGLLGPELLSWPLYGEYRRDSRVPSNTASEPSTAATKP
jgi:hypothetical protein